MVSYRKQNFVQSNDVWWTNLAKRLKNRHTLPL